ncbi:hypothetical protein [Glutamicibacter arilaitensis]|uniref:hypothetical protein n=1 Tax=Glutamicibacter arilaitensis TaxID=256701 RepID=UPI00384DDA4E
MVVSKKRHQRSTIEIRRERERWEIKERAVHRQNRLNQAVRDLCNAEDSREVHAALRQVQKIAPDQGEILSSVLNSEPGDTSGPARLENCH